MQRCAYLKANVYSFTTLNGCNLELKACMKDLGTTWTISFFILNQYDNAFEESTTDCVHQMKYLFGDMLRVDDGWLFQNIYVIQQSGSLSCLIVFVSSNYWLGSNEAIACLLRPRAGDSSQFFPLCSAHLQV